MRSVLKASLSKQVTANIHTYIIYINRWSLQLMSYSKMGISGWVGCNTKCITSCRILVKICDVSNIPELGAEHFEVVVPCLSTLSVKCAHADAECSVVLVRCLCKLVQAVESQPVFPLNITKSCPVFLPAPGEINRTIQPPLKNCPASSFYIVHSAECFVRF